MGILFANEKMDCLCKLKPQGFVKKRKKSSLKSEFKNYINGFFNGLKQCLE